MGLRGGYFVVTMCKLLYVISPCGRDDKLWGYGVVSVWLLCGYFVLATLCDLSLRSR